MSKAKKAAPPKRILFVRNFPEDLNREVKSRAALAGVPIGVYLAALIRLGLKAEQTA